MDTVLIIDAHQHVGDLADALSYDGREPGRPPEVDEDARARLAHMDALGVTWSVLQPSHGYLRAEGLAATQRVNDRMARYQAFAPDRFCVLGTTEPMHGQVGVEEVERLHRLGLKGVAWHHRFQGCFIDSRWMWPTLERMAELGLLPLVHVNAESSMEAHWRLQRLAVDFPDLTFLAMDGLWTYERARHAMITAAHDPQCDLGHGGPGVLHIGRRVGRTQRVDDALLQHGQLRSERGGHQACPSLPAGGSCHVGGGSQQHPGRQRRPRIRPHVVRWRSH